MVGEVWLGSGQSNMNFELGEAMNAQEEIANANYPNIRVFYVNDKSLPEPVKDVRGRWRICTPAEAKDILGDGILLRTASASRTQRPDRTRPVLARRQSRRGLDRGGGTEGVHPRCRRTLRDVC